MFTEKFELQRAINAHYWQIVADQELMLKDVFDEHWILQTQDIDSRRAPKAKVYLIRPT